MLCHWSLASFKRGLDQFWSIILLGTRTKHKPPGLEAHALNTMVAVGRLLLSTLFRGNCLASRGGKMLAYMDLLRVTSVLMIVQAWQANPELLVHLYEQW